jgi:hypothetical protein
VQHIDRVFQRVVPFSYEMCSANACAASPVN